MMTGLACPMVANRPAMTVAIVGNYADRSVLGAAMEAECEIAIIESFVHAYSTIRRAAPHLVVLCVDGDDAEGCQVLSMLKADPVTARIPVITHDISSSTSEVGPEALEIDRVTTENSELRTWN
jgi:CheY-like chemotaxis protein